MIQAPILQEASSFEGSWRLSGPNGDCMVRLLSQDQPVEASSLAAPMHALEGIGHCAALANVRGWRPIPLGLELTDAAGAAVVIFEGVDSVSYRSIDQSWTLRPG